MLFLAVCVSAQSLPFTFENDITTSDFIDFDGGVATVITNPQSGGINTSANVAQIVRNGGQVWAGSKVVLDNNLNFDTDNTVSMKFYTTAAVGTTIKLKLESTTGAVERDAQTTVTSEWEVLTWDFTGVAADFNTIAFMFDYGTTGDGSATSTFLFDDLEQFFGGEQVDLPVDFEGSDVNYALTDFGGTQSELVKDPTNANNMVAKTVKTVDAATWAGTTIGTNAGFATYIPLTLDNSIMSAYVWSPKAGTPIRLKVEDSNDDTHTCETQTNTTKDGAWEVIEFDFATEATGTAKLEFGLSQGWKYNMASIFFNFDTDGATAGEQTYYFDDVTFGELIVGFDETTIESTLNVFPTQTTNTWTVKSSKENIVRIELYNVNGALIDVLTPNTTTVSINASAYAKGTYITKISTPSGVKSINLIKS